MKKSLIWIFVLVFIIISCKEEPILNDNINSSRILMSFTPGNTLEYDETITDSTTLPSALNSLGADMKTRYISKATSKWHITMTVPDTNIKDFKVIRELIIPSYLDTMGSTAHNVWKTESYNGTYREYDENGSLIRHLTLPSDSYEADIYHMPLTYSDNTAISDSLRTLFKTQMTSVGQSVTDNGTEIVSTSSIVDGSHSADVKATFDRDYLLPIKNEVIQNSQIVFTEYNYTSIISSFRIVTQTIEVRKFELNSTDKNYMKNKFTSLTDLDDYANIEQVKITTLSNISF